MTSVLGYTAFRHMQAAQFQQFIAAAERFVIAYRRNCRQQPDVGKRTAVEGKSPYEISGTAETNLRKTCTRLERCLRNGGEIVGDNNLLHAAATEYCPAYTGNIVIHGEVCDTAVAEGIVANGGHSGRQ